MKNSPQNREKGANAEAQFCSRYKTSIVRKATREEDIHEHWDYLTSNNKKIDVKSRNKYSGIVRVETKRRWHPLQDKYPEGVPEHLKQGWLFGEADYIAYQIDDKFEFFKTQDLVEAYEKHKETLEHMDCDEGSQIAKIHRSLLPEPQTI